MTTKLIKAPIFSIVLLGAMFATFAPSAHAQNSLVYDNFNAQWLDPGKWTPGPNCGNWGNGGLDCVREIQNGQLRLSIRNSGATNSDSGNQIATSNLAFNSTSPYRAIAVTATVRNANGGSCATNPYVGTGRATFGGTFFNIGSQDQGDDVNAVLVLSAYQSLNSTMLDVGGWIGSGNGVNIWTHMGYYPQGTPILASVVWDRPNHQFVFSVKPQGGDVNQVAVPYNLPDNQPPVSTYQYLSAFADAPNCSSGRSFSNGEALFDNVVVLK
jgi:hypothetical protein